jgi:hypothetical protein
VSIFDTAVARWDMRGKNSNATSCGTNWLRAEIAYAVAQHIPPDLKMAFRGARALLMFDTITVRRMAKKVGTVISKETL